MTLLELSQEIEKLLARDGEDRIVVVWNGSYHCRVECVEAVQFQDGDIFPDRDSDEMTTPAVFIGI